MRLLHVSAGNLYGGLETVLVTLARCRALSAELQNEFALCFAGRAEDELRAAGATVHRLGEVRVRRPLSILRARRALRALIGERSFDTVVCHSPWTQAIFGTVVRQAGAASIFWLHDVAAGRHWLERWAARVVPDGAICDSRFTAATLPLIYPQLPESLELAPLPQASRVPCEVVYYPVAPAPGVLPADRAAMRAELGVAAQAVVVIQVSRMEQWKGHRLHLKALARLAGMPQWTCWMVGGAQRPHEARYLESLRAEAAALGIGRRVNFLGQRGDVARLLNAADIHCQPNLGPEPFGITFIEALYAGLPVVTTSIGGALEIVDGSCGVLVAPNDPAALAGALGRLIEDRELRARLGTAGPARAAALCEPQAQMRALTRALNRLLPGPARDTRAKPVEEPLP
jgi:glycosyltransferase involved in cell wall biosynthesis